VRLRTPSVAIGAVFLANGLVVGAWAVRVAEVQRSHGLSDAALGVALIAVGVGALLTMPPIGALSGRFGTVGLIRALVVVLAAAPVLAALSHGIPLLVAALAALGAGNGGLDVGMNTQAVGLERVAGRPVMSKLHATFSFGFLGGALISGTLAAVHVAATPALAIVGVVAATAVLATSAGLLADRPASRARPTDSRRPSRQLLLLGVIAFCCLFTEGSIADWGSVYVTGPLGGSATLAGFAFAAFGGGMATGRLVGDGLRVRIGPVRLVVIGASAMGAAMALALLLGSQLAVVPCFAVVGLGLGNNFPVVLSAAGALARPPLAAAAVATVSTCGYTGFLLGPALIGLVAGLASLPLALALAPCAAAVVLALSAKVAPAGDGRA
jgi:MFS family permease